MKTHIFQEVQKVRQPWIYALLVIVFGLWMWQLVQQVFMGQPFGTDPAPNWAILLMGIIPLGAIVLVALLKLETRVYSKVFKYRMWPLQGAYREIRPDEITHWEVKKYSPIRDYGGWGIRTSFTRKGIAFNISGNMGAYFELKNGKKILVGTRKPEELRSAIRQMTSVSG